MTAAAVPSSQTSTPKQPPILRLESGNAHSRLGHIAVTGRSATPEQLDAYWAEEDARRAAEADDYVAYRLRDVRMRARSVKRERRDAWIEDAMRGVQEYADRGRAGGNCKTPRWDGVAAGVYFAPFPAFGHRGLGVYVVDHDGYLISETTVYGDTTVQAAMLTTMRAYLRAHEAAMAKATPKRRARAS